nr:putative reverse transcriptase domain-containing protein [Tanacetum cinerariifolium]
MDSGAVKNKEEGSSKRTAELLESDIPKKQKLDENVEAKVDDSAKLKRCIEIVHKDEDDVTINATPLSSKSPTIIDYMIHKEGKKNYFKITRADEKMYPLTRNTLNQIWNDVRLQVDFEVKMAYDLLKLIRRHIREGYVAQLDMSTAYHPETDRQSERTIQTLEDML